MHPDHQRITRTELAMAHDPLVIDEDTVATACILYPERSVVHHQPRVKARHVRISDHHLTRIFPAQGNAVTINGVSSPLQWSFCGDENGLAIHRIPRSGCDVLFQEIVTDESSTGHISKSEFHANPISSMTRRDWFAHPPHWFSTRR